MSQCKFCEKKIPSIDLFCQWCGMPVAGKAGKSTPESIPNTKNTTPESIPNTKNTTPANNQVKKVTSTQSKIGHLLFPDDSKIIIDDSQRLVGRVNLKEFSKEDFSLISRGHFTVFRNKGIFYINDGSTNVQEKPSEHHTLINDIDITNNGPKELSDGDVIKISDIQIEFKLE